MHHISFRDWRIFSWLKFTYVYCGTCFWVQDGVLYAEEDAPRTKKICTNLLSVTYKAGYGLVSEFFDILYVKTSRYSTQLTVRTGLSTLIFFSTFFRFTVLIARKKIQGTYPDFCKSGNSIRRTRTRTPPRPYCRGLLRRNGWQVHIKVAFPGT